MPQCLELCQGTSARSTFSIDLLAFKSATESPNGIHSDGVTRVRFQSQLCVTCIAKITKVIPSGSVYKVLPRASLSTWLRRDSDSLADSIANVIPPWWRKMRIMTMAGLWVYTESAMEPRMPVMSTGSWGEISPHHCLHSQAVLCILWSQTS